MFPDLASVKPCVTCHNQHPDTPKADWVLGDVMGATTWSYPKANVTMDEFTEGVERVTAGLEKRLRIIHEDEKQRIAYHDLMIALGSNFRRAESLRQMLAHNAPKYGNDNPPNKLRNWGLLGHG